jgi:hypothetical protein
MIDYEKLKLLEELCSKTDGYYFVCNISSLEGTKYFTLCHKDQYDEDLKNIDDLIAKLQDLTQSKDELTEWEQQTIKHLYPMFPMATTEQWKTIAKVVSEQMAIHYAPNELTQPKPKYAIGQMVFFRDDLKIGSFKVDEIVNDYGQDWYIHQHDEGGYENDGQSFDQYEEYELYPTKAELIEAQLEYWQQLRNEAIMGNEWKPPFGGKIKGFDHFEDELEKVECQHETGPISPDMLAKNIFCIKCREYIHRDNITKEECQHESDGEAHPHVSGYLHKKCKKCGEFYK